MTLAFGFAFLFATVSSFGQDAPVGSTQTVPQPGQVQQTAQTHQPLNLPNTPSVPPLTVRDKFKVRVVQSFGIRGFLGTALGAALGQATNTPGEWGQGWDAYAQRYASGFGNNLDRQVFAFTLESALHEDPRYFPSEDKRTVARIKNVITQIVVAKTDSGRNTFAYARVISAFGAAQLTNVWQPKSTGTFGQGLQRTAIIFSGDAAINLIQEFIPATRSAAFRHRP